MSEQRGSVYQTRAGTIGIRWREGSVRKYQSGFPTKTAAKRWFREEIAPRLQTGAPSADITFDAFCALYLHRHRATVTEHTIRTLTVRLAPARAAFGSWSLGDLEHAADDIAAWRATLPERSRYRLTKSLRQVLSAAVRWRYLMRNPAVDAGANPGMRSEELRPFTRGEVDMLAVELGPVFGPMVVFAGETGLRTNEWVALERRDVDYQGLVVRVQRRYSDGVLTPFPKTADSRRSVPLSDRAVGALRALPPRIDTPLLFPTYSHGRPGHLNLGNFRRREWDPALEATGLEGRGPYCLRHSFATWALAAGVSLFELSKAMGTSIRMVDATYGHLAPDGMDRVRERLNREAG